MADAMLLLVRSLALTRPVVGLSSVLSVVCGQRPHPVHQCLLRCTKFPKMRRPNREVHTSASHGERSQQVFTHSAFYSECLLESLNLRLGYLRAVSNLPTYTLLPLRCNA